MTDPTTKAILERVPLKLRNEYDAAWHAYATECRRWKATPEERAYAYEKARAMEDTLQIAIKAAGAEIRRENDRAKAKALSG